MHLSAPFIERPVATSLLSFALLLAGAVAYTQLPVASLPQTDYPAISVGAGLPGGSPETMASDVATPLERQFGRISGVNQMTSQSTLGSTGVSLQFDLTRNIDAAARDVQAAINAARTNLPAYLPQNPGYRKINPAEAPILILTLTSDVQTKPQMYDAADSILDQKISQIDGVGQVFAWGSASPSVRVELNPYQLANNQIGLEAVRTAIANANANRPKGSFQNITTNDDSKRWQISANDQILKAVDYAPLIVGYNPQTGAPVRLSDVATVYDGTADIHNAGYHGKNPDNGSGAPIRGSVVIAIFRVPGANVIKTVDNVLAEIPRLQAQIPPTIKLGIAVDRTTTIRASVHDVEVALLISVVLVIFVVFLFLREIWATIIPAIAVPLSLLGAFGVMWLLGYSIDNLSLMALTIATGFVVDDAIVVIENITRYLEMGYSPWDAAMKGSREIGFTVLSMSASLVAVFIPILLMGGMVGRIFREFAVTLSVAIAVSLLVSLTTTPMLCARFLKPHQGRRHGLLYRLGERAFEWLRNEYSIGLRWVLRHQTVTLLILLATVAFNIYLFVIIPKGFFPQQDSGRIQGMVRGPQDISFDAINTNLKQLAGIVLTDPAISSVTCATSGGNTARMFIALKAPKYRTVNGHLISSDEVINRLRPKISSVPGTMLFLQTQQELSIGARMTDAQYQYTLSGESLNDLNSWAPQLLNKMRTMPQLRDVSTDQQNQGLSAQLVIDRDSASRLGLTASMIDQVLYDAFGQREVSTMYTGINQYFVVMEVDPQFQLSPDSLNGIFIKSSTGAMVPLSAVAHYEQQRTPLAVNHQGQYPSVTLSFNLAPNVALGDAVSALDKAKQELHLPSTITATFQGTAQAYQDALKNEKWLIIAALVAVYIVLGILYESYIHPLTILSTIPPAGVGALLALMATGKDLSIIAIIGVILLIGIVKKNAIMMIDFALQCEREEGLPPIEAIYKACLLRFRPIMMTTFAALFGGFPLAFGRGVGAELRQPLGISIVGGLIVSQLLTLFTTPVVYLMFDRLQWRVMKLHRIGAELDALPEAGD